MDNQKQDPLVGYANAPRTEVKFSLTASELDDLKKYLKANNDASKPSRVYLTYRSGISKAGKNYNMISVYDPNQGNTHKPVHVEVTSTTGDLPF